MLPQEPDRWHLLRRVRSVSWLLGGSALALSVIGLVVISSASADMNTDYEVRQSAWIALGLLVMAAAAAVDYTFLLRYAFWNLPGGGGGTRRGDLLRP